MVSSTSSRLSSSSAADPTNAMIPLQAPTLNTSTAYRALQLPPELWLITLHCALSRKPAGVGPNDERRTLVGVSLCTSAARMPLPPRIYTNMHLDIANIPLLRHCRILPILRRTHRYVLARRSVAYWCNVIGNDWSGRLLECEEE